jgi:hypothetical protein
MSEWLIPASIKNCLDSNLSFKLTHKLGNKRIFTSDAINRLLLIANENGDCTDVQCDPNDCSFNKYTATSRHLEIYNNNFNLSMSKGNPNISFYKLVTYASSSNDLNIALCNINKNQYIYYKNTAWKGGTTPNGFFDKKTGWYSLFGKDISPGNALNFTGIGWNNKIYLYTIIFNKSNNKTLSSFASNKCTIDIQNKNSSLSAADYNYLLTLANNNNKGIQIYDILKYYTITVDSKLIDSTESMWGPSGEYYVPIPHLDIKNGTAQYWGALSSKYYSGKDIIITIGDNVWLPFGFSQSYQSRPLNISGPTPPDGKYLFLKNLITVKDICKPPLCKNEISSNSVQSINLTGGVICGHFMHEDGLFPGWYANNSKTRADCSSLPSTGLILSSIQYWIFAGLLEFDTTDAITIANISVLGGRARGIAAVQLNAYNVNTTDSLAYFGIEANNLLKLDKQTNSTAIIYNSQFICNCEGQADGLDSKCKMTTIENCVIQSIDDCLKIAGDTSANYNTILSGNTGGAINIGAYGFNNPINTATIYNTYIHLLDKTPVPPKMGKTDNGAWPNPGVIFMPQYPTLSNTITSITIDTLSYPVNSGDIYHLSPGTPSSPTSFFLGGYINAGFQSKLPLTTVSDPSINITFRNIDDLMIKNYYNFIYSNIPGKDCNNITIIGLKELISKQC